MCKKIFIITKECEEHGHELESEVCWRQCPGYASNCADGYKEWNTHCGDSVVDVNHDDHRRFMTLVSQNVEEVSSDHCGLCQRSGADHDLAAEQVEQIDARQTDLEAIQAEIGDLENREPPFTDEEAS